MGKFNTELFYHSLVSLTLCWFGISTSGYVVPLPCTLADSQTELLLYIRTIV